MSLLATLGESAMFTRIQDCAKVGVDKYGKAPAHGPGRQGVVALAALAFVILPLAAIGSTNYGPRNTSTSWRERDWKIWHQAHQLYRCDPEQLTDLELHDVRRWCRCLSLIANCQTANVKGLNDAECAFVADVLQDLAPNMAKQPHYLAVYESCRRRQAAVGR